MYALDFVAYFIVAVWFILNDFKTKLNMLMMVIVIYNLEYSI